MKSLRFLLAIVGVLALAACGDTTSPSASSTPDLEATVEARVQATIEAPMPTATVDLEATVTSRVDATREAQPDVTPIATSSVVPASTQTTEPTATPPPESQHNSAIVYYNEGLVHFIEKDYDSSIDAFDMAIELDSKYVDAYFRRGYAYYRKGDSEKAMIDAERAIELDSDHANAYSLRGWLNVENDYTQSVKDLDRAITYYGDAIQQKSADEDTYYFRGVAYDIKKDYDRAIADFTEAIRLNPNYVRAYANRGFAYYIKGVYDRAITDYDKALEMDSNSVVTYFRRGAAYYQKGEFEQAIADYDEALRREPDSEVGYFLRGLTHYAVGDYNRAISDYDKAIALDPNYVSAIEERENAHRWKCDHLSEAIEDFSEEKATGTSRVAILKIYDVQETYRSADRVECFGLAKLSSGSDRNVVFYNERDEDGDEFYGYELKEYMPTPVPKNTTSQRSEVDGERKYELTSSQREGFFQIRATREIPLHGVREGDLGGFVHGEFNLAHDGDAWIFVDAIVEGSARIQGNAAIYGIVKDSAVVEGNAKVYGIVKDQAWVFDFAVVQGIVGGNAKVFGNAVVTGIVTGDSSVSE